MGEAGDVAQFVESLPSMHVAVGSTPALHKIRHGAHAHHLTTWDGSRRVGCSKSSEATVSLRPVAHRLYSTCIQDAGENTFYR